MHRERGNICFLALFRICSMWDVPITQTLRQIAKATTVGHKRIIRLEQPVETQKLKINIEDSKACPVIFNAEIY